MCICVEVQLTALFSRLHRIFIGGLFAAFGVLCMHYIGMEAQRMNSTMEFHGGIVTLSAIIATVTANAAFWILFRVLTFMPKNHLLRLASALIMGAAVCGTHYTGMASCTYAYTTESYASTARVLIDGSHSAEFSSHAAFFICYWVLTYSITWQPRSAASGTTTIHDSNNATHQTGHCSPSHQGSYVLKSSVNPSSHHKKAVGTLFNSTVVENGDSTSSFAAEDQHLPY